MTTYAVVLGGTQFQEGFVKSIIKNGCQPIVLDWDKECYLSSKVDHFFQVDIKDMLRSNQRLRHSWNIHRPV